MRDAQIYAKRGDICGLFVRTSAQAVIDCDGGNLMTRLRRPASKQMQQRHAVAAARHGDSDFGRALRKCAPDPMHKAQIIARRWC
jgi:hypothetical protein